MQTNTGKTMPFSLENAIVYDEESFPNIFTFHAEGLYSDFSSTWEISTYRDDRHYFFTWLNHINRTQTPMIGFNNLNYDYPLLHFIYKNPQCTVEQIYQESKRILSTQDRFGNMIWPRDRLAPQIDLFKIFHFDNKAKTTNLKALQINMRSENVVESAVPFDTWVAFEQVEQDLIPYNAHDVKETKKFALGVMSAINFRVGIVDEFGLDVLNWNDTKIGENILIKKIGDNVCYSRDANGRKQKRQTIRQQIALRDVIFPYISFIEPEFNRVLNYLREQTLKPEEFITDDGTIEMGDTIKTKGVFAGLKAHVAGVDYHFGTGGIHASIEKQHVRAGDGFIIRDIDVASLYPSIAIVNKLYPDHLGEVFIAAYASLPKERKEWQKKKGKKCTEANSLKLASNGAYGKSNDKFSVLFDPMFTMKITINGQLMLAMLVERLIRVPSVQIIQANTDGITYKIHTDYLEQAKEVERAWQEFTLLVLEDVEYSDMWIRDVNNYIAKPVTPPGQNEPPAMKLKGAYWFPESGDRYFDSITEQQPPAWHKDLGNLLSIKAAVNAMVNGVDPEIFIKFHADKFDFMKRIKVGRSDVLTLGEKVLQRNTRYYVARNGARMVKTAPPVKGASVGDFKRANGVPDSLYHQVTQELTATGRAGQWDERIHTKNKSRYEMRETQIEAGFLVCECNNAADFDFSNLNYEYYIAEAKKLIVGA